MPVIRNSYPQKRLMLVLSDFFPAGTHAVFMDRHSGFSLGAGQLSLTPQQETAVAASLSIPDSIFITLRQVHGDRIAAYERDTPESANLLEADGCLTASTRCWISVRTADCLPVFLCDPRKRCIGVVHAGWRGTRAGVLHQAVVRMQNDFCSDPADLIAVLGPCIRSCCYTVGREFCDIFPDDVERRKDRIALDLAGANVRQLLREGVGAPRIYDCRACTCCDSRFFSYRREGAGCGRNLALMVMEEEDIH